MDTDMPETSPRRPLTAPTPDDPVNLSAGMDRTDLHRQIVLLQAELDACAPAEAALVRAERRIAALQSLIERQSARIVEVERHNTVLERDIARLRRSVWWWLSAPVRGLRRWLRRARRKRG